MECRELDIQFGVDYYPEHWPRERWETDARLMEELGVQVVRMAEFSWSRLEPEKGRFRFGWLDDAIALLARHGIRTVLGTPTAAPPAWIIAENPEIQPMDANGLRRHFGGRHHDCQSNAVYREHIRRYVTAFAGHFAKNPNVIGWQVDNELGNSHGNLCFCPSCEERFRQWLREKYGTVESLNEHWGTVFWSQDYSDFSQVTAPRTTAAGQNPSQLLDWKRFCSDLVLEFHQFQAEILRASAPDKFITHNMMGFSEKVSYFQLGDKLDFSSHDQYPGGHFREGQNELRADAQAAELDFIRGTRQKSFWIMEQQSSITGWEVLGRVPKPGQLALWAMQSAAHGADAIVFFRWRSCAVGTEQYWHGILPHSGVPGRSYREIGQLIRRAGPLLRQVRGALPQSRAAIVFSYDQEYAFDIQPHHPQLTYVDHVMTYYRALFRRNIPVDFIREEEDFSRYQWIIAPLQYLMYPELEQKYREYVRRGGNLVLTMRTGVKDAYNRCMCQAPLPGGLSDVLGLQVPEYDCLRETSVEIQWDGRTYTGEKWSDLIEPAAARPLAVYGSEFYAGTPALTVNRFGEGRAYYVGTEMSPALADRFVEEMVSQGLEPLASTPLGVEVARRVSGNRRWYFVLNHTGQTQYVTLPPHWIPWDGQRRSALPPFAADVYTEEEEEA